MRHRQLIHHEPIQRAAHASLHRDNILKRQARHQALKLVVVKPAFGQLEIDGRLG